MAYGDRFGGGNRFNDSGSFAPVKVGDELDVKIEAVGEKGDGIAKKDGFVLFVPNAKEGDEVRVKVTRVLRRVGFAELLGKSDSNSEVPVEEVQEPVEEVQDSEDFGEESEQVQDSEDFGEEAPEEDKEQKEAEEAPEEDKEQKEAAKKK